MAKRDHRNNPQGMQPIAYDHEGRPLYAAPPQASQQPLAQSPSPAAGQSSHVHSAPEAAEGHNFDPKMRVQYANEPKVVHATRQIEPEQQTISEDIQRRHEESKAKYPRLNLSRGECVLLDIKRHPIGLLLPMASVGLIWLVLIIVLVLYPASSTSSLPSYELVLLPALLLMALTGIGGYIAIWVYLQNQFFLTNESVIQEIQHSLFSRFEQTVSLGSIEDASYTQHGILQMFLNYGQIRLSTEGEETTYRFSYVTNPRKQVAILNNAVEDFKNGRAVSAHDN